VDYSVKLWFTVKEVAEEIYLVLVYFV